MSTILITGATDGIGRETAKKLAAAGHTLMLHGRSQAKLDALRDELAAYNAPLFLYRADFSEVQQVRQLAADITRNHVQIDVLINNAGVYKLAGPMTQKPDTRFVVNTIAPYILTRLLLPLLAPDGRVISLSSAAQAAVNLDAVEGRAALPDDMAAYAQSKLAIAMWSRWMAEHRASAGQVFVAVNPGSLLATKMVREGFGVAGADVGMGADILLKLATAAEYAGANGRYFDNDRQSWGTLHPAASPQAIEQLEMVLERILETA